MISTWPLYVLKCIPALVRPCMRKGRISDLGSSIVHGRLVRWCLFIRNHIRLFWSEKDHHMLLHYHVHILRWHCICRLHDDLYYFAHGLGLYFHWLLDNFFRLCHRNDWRPMEDVSWHWFSISMGFSIQYSSRHR